MNEHRPAAAAAPDVAASARRGTTGYALIGSAMLLVCAGTIGYANAVDEGFVWAFRLLNHVFVFGFLAAVLMGFGLSRVIRWGWLRVLAFATCLIVAASWALIGAWMTFMTGVGLSERTASPAGAYQAVVAEGADMIDTLWYVSIEEQSGLLSRRWDLGCINGDWNYLSRVTWRDDQTLVVHTSMGASTVTIDPETHELSRDRPRVWGC